MGHPVTVELERPTAFDRTHVFARIAALVVLGWIVQPFGLLWFGLPIAAAILISRKSGERYLSEDGPMVARALNYVVDLVAYIALLTDRYPSWDQHVVRFEVQPSGSPTARSALMRVVYAIPHVIVLAILTWVATIVWLCAMVLVFFTGTYPESWWRFIHRIVVRDACVVAYLASLVDRYPSLRLA